MNKLQALLIAATLGSAALAGTAQAQAQAPAPAPAASPATPAATAPQAALLTIRQIYDTLEAAGYRTISEIELSHLHYEVEADDAQGRRVKLHVNARTGAVERSKFKH